MDARCEVCKLVLRACLCGRLPVVQPSIRVHIIQHSSEQKRASNSGRLLQQIIGAKILPYGKLGSPFDPSEIPDDGVRLLYPEGPVESEPEKPKHLLVIDGSWTQSRRIRVHEKGIRGIPTLHINVPAVPMIRKQTEVGRGATALAVAVALRLFGDDEAAFAIEEGYRELQDRLNFSRRGGRKDSQPLTVMQSTLSEDLRER